VHALKAYRRRRVKDTLILNFGIFSWVITFTHWLLYFWGKNPSYPFVLEKRKMKTSWPCRDSEHQIDELSYPCGEVGFICIIMFQLIVDVKHCCLKIIFWDVALCVLYLCTKLYSATPQKTATFIASVLIGQVWFSYCVILLPEKITFFI